MSAQLNILENPEILPRDVARMALAASGNITAKATDWFLNYMRENPDWVAIHMDAIFRNWAVVSVGSCLKLQGELIEGRRGRGAATFSATQSVVPFQSALSDAVNANYSRMMDAPIWGGKKIGDATPQEIRESAHLFAENGKTMTRKAAWQNAVADAAEKNGAGINEPVRKVLSPKTFEQLWEESDAA